MPLGKQSLAKQVGPDGDELGNHLEHGYDEELQEHPSVKRELACHSLRSCAARLVRRMY